MLEICAIASGSNGNCYYVGNKNDAILIDAGISKKQILLRMKQRNLLHDKIKAIFISHEHSDHISGARVMSKRLNIPVYITPKTYNGAYKNQRPDYPKFFAPGDIVEIGEFSIHSFLKNHDASEPCSFRVQYRDKNIGVFTDITLKYEPLLVQNATFVMPITRDPIQVSAYMQVDARKFIPTQLGGGTKNYKGE